MRGRSSRRGFGIGLMGLAMAAAGLLAASPAGASTATPFGTNLIKNGGAEQGGASSDGNSGVPIPHWDTNSTTNFTVVKYGTASGFPTKKEGKRINGHTQFLTTGAYDSGYGGCDDASQNVVITGRNSAVDKHHVKVVLTAHVATFADQSDTAHINLYFGTRSDNSANGGAHVTPQTATNDKFKLVSVSKVLPKYTGQIRVRLWANHTSGYCDAYFDNITLKIFSV